MEIIENCSSGVKIDIVLFSFFYKQLWYAKQDFAFVGLLQTKGLPKLRCFAKLCFALIAKALPKHSFVLQSFALH